MTEIMCLSEYSTHAIAEHPVLKTWQLCTCNCKSLHSLWEAFSVGVCTYSATKVLVGAANVHPTGVRWG